MAGVVFRRVKGRIIPLRLTESGKRQIKQGAQGTALVAGGAAIAASAGKLHRAAVKFSTSGSIRAFRSLEKLDKLKRIPRPSLFGAALRNARITDIYQKTEQLSKASARLGRFTPAIRIGGLAVGAALAGAGIAKIYKAREPQASKKKIAAVTAIGATGATAAFLAGGYGGAGARAGLKSLYIKAYPVLRALKARYRI
jgi:hypothetical protein